MPAFLVSVKICKKHCKFLAELAIPPSIPLEYYSTFGSWFPLKNWLLRLIVPL